MAVSDAGFRIVERAVQIRLAQGESLEDVIASYPKLSKEQADTLRQRYGKTN